MHTPNAWHPIARHLLDALLACRDLPRAATKHGVEIARNGDIPTSVGPLDAYGCALAGWSDTGRPPVASQHEAVAFHATLRAARVAFDLFVDALRAHPALGEASTDVTVRLRRTHPHAPTRFGPFVEVWMGHCARTDLPNPKGHTRLTPTHWAGTRPITVALAIDLFDKAAKAHDAPRLHAIERPGDDNPFHPRAAWIGTDALRALEPLYAGATRPLMAWTHDRHQPSPGIGDLVPTYLPASLIETYARLVDVSQAMPDLEMHVTLRGDGTHTVAHPALDRAGPLPLDAWLQRPHARYHAAWARDVQAAWWDLWAGIDAFAPAITRTARAWQHAWHVKATSKHAIGAQLVLFGLRHRFGGAAQGAIDGLEDVLSWMAGVTPHDGWAVSRPGITGPAFVPGKDAEEALAVGFHLHRLLGAGEVTALDLWTPAG